MLPHLIIHSSLHYLSTGPLQEVKIKKQRKLQTFSYKSGRGRLREVVASLQLSNIVTWLGNFQYFGIGGRIGSTSGVRPP